MNSRGNIELIYEENIYKKIKESHETTYWKCKGDRCQKKILLDETKYPATIKEIKGTHSPHNIVTAKEVMVLKIKYLLKTKFYDDPTQPFRRLINSSLRIIGKHPPYRNVAIKTNDVTNFVKFLERVKKDYYGGHIPTNINSLENCLKELEHDRSRIGETSKGENFVHIVDDFIFCTTKKNLEALINCHTILGDGTFRYAPRKFTQIFTIHGFDKNRYFPAISTFLKEKTEPTYTSMLNALKTLCNDVCGKDINPKRFILDFETASRNAVKTCFPGTSLRGCRFHLLQSWFKRIKNDKILRQHYEDPDSKIGKWLKCHFGLPFLPSELIPRAWNILGSERPASELKACDIFTNYLLEYYVDRGADKLSESCLFPPYLWAGEPIDPVVMNERETRTSNACESFHRFLNEVFNKTHPPLSTVIYELLLNQEKTYIILNSLGDPSCEIKTNSYRKNFEISIDVHNKYKAFKESQQSDEDITDYLYDVACRYDIYKESISE